MNDQSQLARVGLFDARVPRYTSYPTAPHFTSGIGPDDFSDWLSAIPAGSEISLYMHVPFCRRLCWFCACRTQGTSSDAPVLAYAEDLKAEIRLIRDRLAPGVRLSRLHWGGGTPTLMPARTIREIAGAIFQAVPMSEHGEFSVEIDPNEIDAERLDALVAAGMNRASIGVQDFDPAIQEVIGREQSYELTREVAEMIRARGVTSLNADILFGLPHQSPERMADSVEKLLTLAPDRVALYGYAHVPWMARRQVMLPSDAMPTPQERLVLFETARRLFVGAGYDEIGIDHFAKPSDGLAIAAREGRLRRNFQGYTDDTAPVLVGIGASAISKFPQGYAQNAPATGAHVGAIRGGRFSTSRGHAFVGEDLLRARMIEALMCDFRIVAKEMIERFRVTPERLAELFEAAAKSFPGMVEVSSEGFSIPERMRAVTRMVARAFDAYELSKAGHSPAI
ncbi:oxygen-independent coproporphyrinogen III oxidase [Ostreiculturibacter nitratireducens]|uniref:oxygen-independent coproporphyrinogen III oxidase n=1 Tax=Ostreiculturibacter nitratireducens TaxID=3075226 RepID=UPI0031B58B53